MSRLKQSSSPQRQIPSVDALVRELGDTDLPRPLVVQLIRRELASLRSQSRDPKSVLPDALSKVRAALDHLKRSRILPVINATGVIIHTNLGRSPLSDAAVIGLVESASNYTNLEYDIAEGRRGQRGLYVEETLAVLSGAQAATVVNNCAAALVLILRHFASSAPRNEVVISRGELVQIGGGFRIPEILEAGGARLREVGTTNKTTAQDYHRAINANTALLLKVHHSNFYMEGFVESPTAAALAEVAQDSKIPLLVDLGSGATFDTSQLGGNEYEPTPRQELAQGADLVCFSGDKLMGGPQAGIIAGSTAYITALKQEPFFRALRCDKLILSALEATANLLLRDQIEDVPIRAMMTLDDSSLQPRARRVIDALNGLPLIAELGVGRGQVGGGSLPRTFLPSVTVELRPTSPSHTLEHLSRALHLGNPPVIARIENDRLKFDLRTVFPRQDDSLIAAIRAAFSHHIP
jgi:L-seryl-tRNA(Ser) seleniumtransferase